MGSYKAKSSCKHKNSINTRFGMICPVCSDVKIWFGLTNEYKNRTGIYEAYPFYSRLSHNGWALQSIMRITEKNISKSAKFTDYYNNSNKIIFYNNQTREVIAEKDLRK